MTAEHLSIGSLWYLWGLPSWCCYSQWCLSSGSVETILFSSFFVTTHRRDTSSVSFKFISAITKRVPCSDIKLFAVCKILGSQESGHLSFCVCLFVWFWSSLYLYRGCECKWNTAVNIKTGKWETFVLYQWADKLGITEMGTDYSDMRLTSAQLK